MSNITETARSFVEALFKDFLQRDVLGFVFPGYLVWCAVWLTHPDSLKDLATWPTALKAFLVCMSFALAYVTGLAVQALGIRLGVIRYYPFGVSKSQHQTRANEVREACLGDQSKLNQRERFVILKQVSGNSAVALLLSILLLVCTGTTCGISRWYFSGLAVLLLLAHFETVYNQRSWEHRVLDKPESNDPGDRFFATSLLESIFGWCARGWRAIYKRKRS